MFKTLFSKKDFSGVIVVTIGSYMASFFSYLLQFFLGRYLTIEDYGTFNAFLALSYLLGVPAGVFSTALVKYVSEQSGKKDFQKLSAMFFWLVKISLFAGLGLFVLLVLLSEALAKYLNISDTGIILYYAILMSGTYTMVIPTGYLQGLLRYRSYALATVAFSFLRLLFPVIFVLLGYKLYGVFGGMTVSMVIGTIVGYVLLKRNIVKLDQQNISEDFKKIVEFSLPVMFVTFGLTLLNNIDVILVKRLFTPEEAGYYAGVVTLGKILLFGTSTVSVVMYPKISHLVAAKSPILKKIFFFSLIQTGVVAMGTLMFSIFPSLLTLAFFGERFTESVKYLPTFSIFIGLYVLVNFCVLLLLALEKTRVFMFLLPAVFIQYLLISNSLGHLYGVIRSNILVTGITLCFLVWYSIRSVREYTTS